MICSPGFVPIIDLEKIHVFLCYYPTPLLFSVTKGPYSKMKTCQITLMTFTEDPFTHQYPSLNGFVLPFITLRIRLL